MLTAQQISSVNADLTELICCADHKFKGYGIALICTSFKVVETLGSKMAASEGSRKGKILNTFGLELMMKLIFVSLNMMANTWFADIFTHNHLHGWHNDLKQRDYPVSHRCLRQTVHVSQAPEVFFVNVFNLLAIRISFLELTPDCVNPHSKAWQKNSNVKQLTCPNTDKLWNSSYHQ